MIDFTSNATKQLRQTKKTRVKSRFCLVLILMLSTNTSFYYFSENQREKGGFALK